MDIVEELINRLKRNSESRWKAIHALGKLGDSRAVEHLFPFLEYKFLLSRWLAISALGKIAKTGNSTPLVIALGDERYYVRRAAAKILDNTDWTPSKNKESALYLAAKQEWDELLAVGTEAVEPLIRLTTDSLRYIREHAVETLGKIGDPTAVDPLITALKDEDLNVRKKAIQALGEIGNPPAVDVLMETLKETDTEIRRDAMKALGQAGDIRAVEPLIVVLKDKKCDIETRRVVTKALGRIKEPRAVTRFIRLLEDSIPDVRKNAAVILGNIGDTRAMEPLIRALRDEQIEVSGEAATALGKIGDVHAVEPLYHKMRDEQADWEKAALALGEIGDARALEPLIGMKWKSMEVHKILNKIGNKLSYEDLDFLCEQCLCRARKFQTEPSLSILLDHIYIYYYACRMCRSNLFLLSGIKTVVLLLDQGCEEIIVKKEESVTVNWLKRQALFDFDEIRITETDDYEVEKLVLTLRNDMDDQRRKRLAKIPVYLSPHLKLSPAKMNLLKDNFPGKIIIPTMG